MKPFEPSSDMVRTIDLITICLHKHTFDLESCPPITKCADCLEIVSTGTKPCENQDQPNAQDFRELVEYLWDKPEAKKYAKSGGLRWLETWYLGKSHDRKLSDRVCQFIHEILTQEKS